MAWTNPADKTTGEVVTAAAWNALLGTTGSLAQTSAAKVTTAGDITYATAANTLARLGIGSSAQVLTVSGGLPAWAAGATSDVVLVGSSSVATATTSLTPVTLVTISGLSILVTQPFRVDINGRKQALSANSAGFGITLNSTVVLVGDTALNLCPQFTGTNQAEQLRATFSFAPRSSADYLFGFSVLSVTRVTSTGALAKNTNYDTAGTPTGTPPNATITSVLITGSNNTGSVALEVFSIRILTGII